MVQAVPGKEATRNAPPTTGSASPCSQDVEDYELLDTAITAESVLWRLFMRMRSASHEQGTAFRVLVPRREHPLGAQSLFRRELKDLPIPMASQDTLRILRPVYEFGWIRLLPDDCYGLSAALCPSAQKRRAAVELIELDEFIRLVRLHDRTGPQTTAGIPAS